MSKTKKSGIPHYELLFIVSNKFTEDEVKPIVEDVKKIIELNGGKITYAEVWGKKKFCYQIAGFSHGYYNLFEFDCAGQGLKEINEKLRLSGEILRHMIVTKASRTLEEIAEEKRKSQAQIQKQAKAAQEKIEEIEKAEEKKENKREDKKVNLKELDDKLDKILETDDLL
jgi:small subunit ribosomal protein S6